MLEDLGLSVRDSNRGAHIYTATHFCVSEANAKNYLTEKVVQLYSIGTEPNSATSTWISRAGFISVCSLLQLNLTDLTVPPAQSR